MTKQKIRESAIFLCNGVDSFQDDNTETGLEKQKIKTETIQLDTRV